MKFLGHEAMNYMLSKLATNIAVGCEECNPEVTGVLNPRFLPQHMTYSWMMVSGRQVLRFENLRPTSGVHGRSTAHRMKNADPIQN